MLDDYNMNNNLGYVVERKDPLSPLDVMVKSQYKSALHERIIEIWVLFLYFCPSFFISYNNLHVKYCNTTTMKSTRQQFSQII